MGIIAFIILGGIVGWAAARLLGRDEGVGMSVIIGIVGSFIGGIISQAFGGVNQSAIGFSWSGIVWSLIGAVIFVAILNTMSRRQHHA